MRKVGSDGKEQRSANFYKAPYVTTAQFAALTPVDGDECYLIADATNGVIWHLRYNAGSASPYKWEFLGGPGLVAEILTVENTTGGGWVDLATIGPSITVPRAGDYMFSIEASMGNATYENEIGLSVGGVDPSPPGTGIPAANSAMLGGTGVQGTKFRRRKLTGLASSTVLKMRYSEDSTAVNYNNRTLIVTPVRIS